MTGEPTRTIGVWGSVGRAKGKSKRQVNEDALVHYCVPGQCLLDLHPECDKDAKKYLRPGRLWEIRSDKHGKHRLIRLHLKHWDINNPRTCPDCKEDYLLLLEQRAGLPGKVDEDAGQKQEAAKV